MATRLPESELTLLNAFRELFIERHAGFPAVASFHGVINAIFPYAVAFMGREGATAR